jgi:hypothetical protein
MCVSSWVSCTVSMRVRPSRVNRSPNRARHDASGPGAWTRTRVQVRDAGTETDCVVIEPKTRKGGLTALTDPADRPPPAPPRVRGLPSADQRPRGKEPGVG